MHTPHEQSRGRTPPSVGEIKWGRRGSTAAAPERPRGQWAEAGLWLPPVSGASSSGIILAPRGKKADVFLKGGARHNRLQKSSDVFLSAWIQWFH